MRTKRSATILLAIAVGTSACSKHEYEPEGNREARLDDAEARFAEVVWDTISWDDGAQRSLEGNGVFAAKCRNCHGPLGLGGTEYAVGRGLDVPSLVEEGWPMAHIDSIRHRVFVGHVAGMPTWGVAGITEREIDAVSHYLLEELRPEVLEGGSQP